MLHWNSFWVHNGPDGKPAAGPTPALDQPWPLEHLMALQTRNWEHMVAASQAWWSFSTTAWSMPGWVLSNWSRTLSNTVADVEATTDGDVAESPARRTAPRRHSVRRSAG